MTELSKDNTRKLTLELGRSIDIARRILGKTRSDLAMMLPTNRTRSRDSDEVKNDEKRLYDLSRSGTIVRTKISRHYLELAHTLRVALATRGHIEEFDRLTAACRAYNEIVNPFHVSKFLALPDIMQAELQDSKANYRFRKPLRESELDPFVLFSDSEDDIRGAHAGLVGENRRHLYWTWFCKRPDCFLILDEVVPQEGLKPVAVSIILPLTQEARNEFCAGALLTVKDDNRTSDLTERLATATYNPKFLLYDTFIVGKARVKRNGQPIRYRLDLWKAALVFRHLSMFLEKKSELELLVEPDFWQIRLECDILGFKEIHSKLWSIRYVPGNDDNRIFFDMFWHNIDKAKKWPD
jgi:hypothetical protein